MQKRNIGHSVPLCSNREEETKTKKGKFKTPRIVRELITGHTLTEDILFAGNA
jgi:hypothetical protein